MADAGAPTTGFKYITRKRRTKEDRRFLTGRGRFVADIELPGMKHACLVTSPHPSARIVSIDTSEALAMDGVHYVLTGAELQAGTNELLSGLDLPAIHRYPMADGVVRYVGEWVAVVVADSRYLAEDAAETIVVDYEPLPFVIDPEEAFQPGSHVVHADHGSNVLFHRTFVWGTVEDDFAAAEHQLSLRVRWNRNSSVPIETFGVVASWDPGTEILDVWASIQMPKYHDQIARALGIPGNAVRVHYDVDVGGSYGVKRGIKHSVVACYLARRLGMPVRLIEDRLENMTGGDAHGPDRIFDVSVAFQGDGIVRSIKIRALDDVGCYPGRAPLQLGKPVGAIVGPYKIASAEYEAISVTTNKTSQEAVRGFGQSPTNYAIETAMDRIARHLGMDRLAVRLANFIRKEDFPYTIPSGSTYDSGDYHAVMEKLVDFAKLEELYRKRDALRAEGELAGVGLSTCLEPSGGNSAFEPLFNPKNDTTTWMESCQLKVDLAGTITVIMATSTSGQGHETLASTVVGEELGIDPEKIRVIHADSLAALPSNSPVGSRMAIMLGGAASHAARNLLARMTAIAAHQFQLPPDRIAYDSGTFTVAGDTSRALSWAQIVEIAHRKFHLMPADMEPGLQETFVWEVPTGGILPTEDGRVHIYPCYSFEAHIPLVRIDKATGKVEILDYFVGHDCGTQINPDIVHGMTYGGIAHGIGAALYEWFEYNPDGQLLAATFMDYLIPSSHEVPEIRMIDHCTPSPLTPLGQKGSGEAGYLGAPAAISSAVNDALAPLGMETSSLPMRLKDLGKLIATKAD